MSRPLLSVVVPLYNEAANVQALLERLDALAARLGADGVDTEVLLVDDHATDQTPELLRAACAERPGLRYLRLARNHGSHVAILAGLEHARGDCAAFLAADLQDPPELIAALLERWRAGDQVVWAVRSERRGESLVTRATSALFYRLLNWIGDVQLPPQGSDFALLDARVVQALLAAAGANPSLGGEIAQLGFRQSTIPYVKAARHAGRSKWTLRHKLKAFADALVSFSYTPLRLMSYLGIACSLLGFAYAALVVALRLLGNPTQGWASLMVAVLVLGGVQMSMLGVLGEYLWRTLGEARRRPRYALEDTLEDTREDAREDATRPPAPLVAGARGRDQRPVCDSDRGPGRP